MKFLLASILTIVLFLVYSYHLSDTFFFTSDFGRDLYHGARIAQGELVLIGSKMDLGGYFVGPYFYYLLSLPLLISQFNVEFVLYFHAFLFAASLGFFFWVIAKKYNLLKATLATVSIGLLPLFILSARYPSNGYSFLPLLLILLIFVLFFKINQKRAILLGILTGIIFNIHPTTIFATGFIFFYLLLFLKQKKLFLLFLGGFLITFLPLLIFELRHNFVMSRDTFINKSYLTFTQDRATPQFWLHQNKIISTFLFLSDKFKKLVILPPIFYFGAILLSLWKRQKKEIKLDLFLAASAILSFIALISVLRFHFEDHYIFSTLFLVTFTSIIILIRSKLWWLLLAVILLEINIFLNQTYHISKRDFKNIESAVKYSIDQKLVKKDEPFNLIQITDAYGLVPTGFEYRFFFRKIGFYPNSEYDYKNAKKLLIFSETPYYDIDKFKMWATEEFGRQYFSKRNTYQSGPITIYLISK